MRFPSLRSVVLLFKSPSDRKTWADPFASLVSFLVQPHRNWHTRLRTLPNPSTFGRQACCFSLCWSVVSLPLTALDQTCANDSPFRWTDRYAMGRTNSEQRRILCVCRWVPAEYGPVESNQGRRPRHPHENVGARSEQASQGERAREAGLGRSVECHSHVSCRHTSQTSRETDESHLLVSRHLSQTQLAARLDYWPV